ncbi:MAG: HupE/UreJ family protein [Acidobacteriota bacterium]
MISLKRLAPPVALALSLAALPAAAPGHQLGLSWAAAAFHRDGTYTLDLAYDLNALMAGARPGHLTPEEAQSLLTMEADERERALEAVRTFMGNSLHVRFDGRPATPQVLFPEMGEGKAAVSPPMPLPGYTLRLAGEIPPGAERFTLRTSPLIGSLGLTLQVDLGPMERVMLEAGEESAPFSLGSAAPPRSGMAVVGRYLRLGFKHILPKGLDHILFVLGLYLLNARLRPLLFQVTAFTLAHSMSLGLSMYGIISLPSSVVEPLIALSIAYVALENVATRKLTPWRPAVVFGFGLLHGLGFASVLQQLGLPRRDFLAALLSFNTGVELGQLAVIGLAFAVSGWWSSRAGYRRRFTVPASLAIALTGLYWAVQRTFFP